MNKSSLSSDGTAILSGIFVMFGIGIICAINIVAIVVDAHRFPHSRHYLSYCGLVKHERISGSRSFGRRQPRSNHTLKGVLMMIPRLSRWRAPGPANRRLIRAMKDATSSRSTLRPERTSAFVSPAALSPVVHMVFDIYSR